MICYVIAKALHYYHQAAAYFDKVEKGITKTAAQIAMNMSRVYKLLNKGAESGVYMKKAVV